MKNICKKILIGLFIISSIVVTSCDDGVVKHSKYTSDTIAKVSMTGADIQGTGDNKAAITIRNLIMKVINFFITILFGLLVFYMVYSGAKLIMSMGTNDTDISQAKRSLWYSALGALFVSLSSVIFNSYVKLLKGHDKDIGAFSKNGSWANFFENSGIWDDFISPIVGGLEIIIFFSAIVYLIFTGLKFITMGNDPVALANERKKLFYTVIVLLFVGFIEVWKYFIFTGDMDYGIGIVGTIVNILLFVAPLVGFFFIILGGYYLITSRGDDEKLKKAKNIIIGVLLGTLIYLGIYVFVNEILGVKEIIDPTPNN